MLTHLECTRCGEHYPADRPQSVCPKDGGILYARYDLPAIKRNFPPPAWPDALPPCGATTPSCPTRIPSTLGEGFTPMLASREYPNVYIKDEGLNPTGSFKARGLSAAVTMARHFGLKKLAIPSAGNAASALAAYAAAAGIEAHIFMPKDVPHGQPHRVQRLRRERHAGRRPDQRLRQEVAELKDSESWKKDGWFDVCTPKEPYRVEGKKTMGYEVAEQLGWRMPQAIIYPTGGGVGLIGMWKAFEEMEALGWIGSERPKMIVVQSAGCAPIVKAWDERQADHLKSGRTPPPRRRPARPQALRRLPDPRHINEEQRHRRSAPPTKKSSKPRATGQKPKASSPPPKAPPAWSPTANSAPAVSSSPKTR